MKENPCKILALSLLKDADDDVRGRDSSDPDNVIVHPPSARRERLKANALSFFFSRDSETCVRFWCDMAGQPLERFRHKLQKYRK